MIYMHFGWFHLMIYIPQKTCRKIRSKIWFPLMIYIHLMGSPYEKHFFRVVPLFFRFSFSSFFCFFDFETKDWKNEKIVWGAGCWPFCGQNFENKTGQKHYKKGGGGCWAKNNKTTKQQQQQKQQNSNHKKKKKQTTKSNTNNNEQKTLPKTEDRPSYKSLCKRNVV